MTPSLLGRIQSRLIFGVVSGTFFGLILSQVFDASIMNIIYTLFLVLAIGSVLDLGYNKMQKKRWDQDWPPIYFLLAAALEFVISTVVLKLSSGNLGIVQLQYSGEVFGWHFWLTWVGMMLLMFQLCHIFDPEYRYNGGKLLRR